MNQQLAFTPVLFVNNYMITHHTCQSLELYDHTLMNNQCPCTKLKSYVNIMLTILVNHDHEITQCQQISLNATVISKNLSYNLQMAELPVNICILYKIYMVRGHTM